MGTGYPKCRQVTLPVGDLNGNTTSPYDNTRVWIKGEIGPGRTQTRWVQDKDASGYPIFMSRTDYENDPKLYYPDGTPIEGFTNPDDAAAAATRTVASLLFGGLVFAAAVYVLNKNR